MQGIIEKRDNNCEGIVNSKKVFLVNKSRTERYSFTVKFAETINDTNYNYTTHQFILAPGDEVNLGCDLFFTDQKYLSIDKINLIDSSQVANVPQWANLVDLHDTLINGVHLHYQKVSALDISKVLSQNKHLIKFEVTGQTMLKADKIKE